MKLRIAFAVVVGLALACKRWDYHCDDDEMCVTDDEQGTCEAEGWCSYSDPLCDSGARWGPQAGPYANDCLEPRTSSSSSTDTSSSSSTDASSSSTTESSSSTTSSSSSTDASSSSSG